VSYLDGGTLTNENGFYNLTIPSNAWLTKDVKGLNIKINDNMSIQPSLENIMNGKYPITRNLEIVTRGQPTGELNNFINYLLSKEGQKFVEKAGYVKINH